MDASKLTTGRQNGKHQVESQRLSILEAAETVFLRQGLANTSMVEVAAAAGITKVTLYRYFSNLDAIALEVHRRTLLKMASFLEAPEQPNSLTATRQLAQSLIRNFDALRDAFRLLGMFDQLYLDTRSDGEVSQAARRELADLPMITTFSATDRETQRSLVILSSVLWFLEKVALRGELTWSAHDIPLAEQLQVFEEMITLYIEHLLATA